MTDTDLCYLAATELRQKFADRELSPVEVTEATLDRIESLNPSLNAYVTVTAERAMESARVAEAQYLLGILCRPLRNG
jgi:Asp-tRNA(Asn)/Glu-tRNA(Gln) amidotransferase A subunit family amidase